MRIAILLLVVAALPCVLRADDKPADKTSDQDLIQGLWKVVSARRNGMHVEVQAGFQVFFQGDRTGAKLGDKTANESRFKLLPDTTPKHMDLKKTDEGPVTKVIYSLDGDTLKLVVPRGSTRPRPMDFTGNALDGSTLMTLQRVRQTPQDD